MNNFMTPGLTALLNNMYGADFNTGIEYLDGTAGNKIPRFEPDTNMREDADLAQRRARRGQRIFNQNNPDTSAYDAVMADAVVSSNRADRAERLNAPQGRENAPFMRNLARSEPVEEYTNDQFMTALAKEATKSQARDAKASRPAKRKTASNKKVLNDAQTMINSSAGIPTPMRKPSHAERLAMLNPTASDFGDDGMLY